MRARSIDYQCVAITQRTGKRCSFEGRVSLGNGSLVCLSHWEHGFVRFDEDSRDPRIVERMELFINEPIGKLECYHCRPINGRRKKCSPGDDRCTECRKRMTEIEDSRPLPSPEELVKKLF